MNEFTKEELLILHLELETRIATTKILKVPKHVIELKDKIESMIDSYCEHDKPYYCDFCEITSCEDCLKPIGGELCYV